jgi:hypothetical protein
LLGPRMSSLLAFLQHTQYLSVQYQLDPLAHLNLDTKHRCACWIVWIFNEYAIYMHECLDHWASARLGGFNKDLCVDDLSARSPVHSEQFRAARTSWVKIHWEIWKPLEVRQFDTWYHLIVIAYHSL